MEIRALELYRAGAKYYGTIKKCHDGPKLPGKQTVGPQTQIIIIIPYDPFTRVRETTWKYLKMQHFALEDIRLLSVLELNSGRSGYCETIKLLSWHPSTRQMALYH